MTIRRCRPQPSTPHSHQPMDEQHTDYATIQPVKPKHANNSSKKRRKVVRRKVVKQYFKSRSGKWIRARPKQPGKRAVARKKATNKFRWRSLQRRVTAAVVTLEAAKQARMWASKTSNVLTPNSLAAQSDGDEDERQKYLDAFNAAKNNQPDLRAQERRDYENKIADIYDIRINH